MSYRTTEIASAEEISDNVIHQRLLYPYLKAAEIAQGDVLEIGCGFGRGVSLIAPSSQSFTGIDKNTALISELSAKYPNFRFLAMVIPPLTGLKDESFDMVVTFQVIEHIENDRLFVEEIRRVLRKGGKAIITTPNKKLSLTRNPWHVREYEIEELRKLLATYFSKVDIKGITGNEKVWEYYRANKESVRKFTRFDIFNLQYRLPRRWLQIPYDIANRLNRRFLHRNNQQLVSNVTTEDYFLSDNPDACFDFYAVVEK
ncbi:MAG: class I SAM-dependent methyltransferase [Flammeovirgaceae bacterium]|nr:class I SAM-dependent methyltransferase [Flammeovirgaceae bacterium]MDW8287895.1 class I SAM-dependent methyltransferase [Flammeovirgaceae bacterium]